MVLSREMSLEEIRDVAKAGIELEAFVHGALCMCVSGQCYMSRMLGGRSANRGMCAQLAVCLFQQERRVGVTFL